MFAIAAKDFTNTTSQLRFFLSEQYWG
jgi:hypothetical protein